MNTLIFFLHRLMASAAKLWDDAEGSDLFAELE